MASSAKPTVAAKPKTSVSSLTSNVASSSPVGAQASATLGSAKPASGATVSAKPKSMARPANKSKTPAPKMPSKSKMPSMTPTKGSMRAARWE
jgi:hypothetical protein